MTTLYGIKNCDTVKRALSSLNTAAVTHTFHDFKKQGLDQTLAQRMIDALGAEALVNRRGTTWRKLSEDEQSRASGSELAALLVENPSLIKRPAIEHADQWRVGFPRDDETEILAWLTQ